MTICCTMFCLIFIDQPELPDNQKLWTPWHLTLAVFLPTSSLGVSYQEFVGCGIHCPQLLLRRLLLTILRNWLTTFCCLIVNLLFYHYFSSTFLFSAVHWPALTPFGDIIFWFFQCGSLHGLHNDNNNNNLSNDRHASHHM